MQFFLLTILGLNFSTGFCLFLAFLSFCENLIYFSQVTFNFWGDTSASSILRSEIVHVWKGDGILARGPKHSAQMVLDGVSFLSEKVSSLGSQHSKALSDWMADKVAPTYWKPNAEIIVSSFSLVSQFAF